MKQKALIQNGGGGGNPQQKTVTPYITGQSVTPDTGYDCLSQVDIEPIYYNETDYKNGILVTIGTIAPE